MRDRSTNGRPARHRLAISKVSGDGRRGLPGFRRRGLSFSLGLLVIAAGTALPRAAIIEVPNASFESPGTDFVTNIITAWRKTAKPAWYDESGGFYWDQLFGLFLNPSPDDPRHIDNCDGNQALYLFAVPELGLFLDETCMDESGTTPVFAKHFEAGYAYRLAVSLVGSGGGMAPGTSMRVGMYYRNSSSNIVLLAATNIIHSTDLFSNTSHLLDFQVDLPTVKAGDAWAGRNIGLELSSTVSFELQGGYWDLDNVRLSSYREPTLIGATVTSNALTFTLESDPGLTFEIVTSTNMALPSGVWTPLGTLTNLTGSVSFSEPVTNAVRRFYRAVQVPGPGG